MPEETKQSNTQTGDDKHEPKLTKTEILFIGGLYALSDIFAFLITPLGLSSLISIPRAGASQIYFYFKKMGTEITITNWITGAVTGAPEIGGAIPSTIGWIAIVIMDQVGMAKLQKIMERTGKAGKLIKNASEKAKIK